MIKKPEARKIFNKWKTDFRGFNKKREAIPHNFDQLFYAFSTSDVDFDTAEAYISDAVAVHLPDLPTCKRTFKYMKGKEFYTLDEFVASWKEDIELMGRESFYRWYDLEVESAPKKIGGMEPQSYIKYKKYIDSFPTVDLKAIREASAQVVDEEDVDFGDL